MTAPTSVAGGRLPAYWSGIVQSLLLSFRGGGNLVGQGKSSGCRSSCVIAIPGGRGPRTPVTALPRRRCLDEMIISLYAGGMTIRDIQHHLARTIGTDFPRHDLEDHRRGARRGPGMAVPAAGGHLPDHLPDALVVKVRDGHHVRNRSAPIAVG